MNGVWSTRAWRVAVVVCGAVVWAAAVTGCGGDDLPDPDVDGTCDEAGLIAQCPAGSDPVLGSQATEQCAAKDSSGFLGSGATTTAKCEGSGSCQVLCQFQTPCTCGVESVSKDAVICSTCEGQSCGDSRCEGTERPTCEPGQVGCQPCLEDCGGATCGDGDCTADESPTDCPQDCAAVCQPDSARCVGTVVVQCASDGRSATEFDCASVGLTCVAEACVQANVCGNGACDGQESPQSCPQDCASGVCAPDTVRCSGQTALTCAPDGDSESSVDCTTTAQICSPARGCVTPDVCGNGVCESGEDEASCAGDCAVVCGNGICEQGEEGSCPNDCTTCGNGVCESGETASCPTDCGVCTPSSRVCLGNTLRVCAANGTTYTDADCTLSDQLCGRGQCVNPDVCGNGICETDEFTTCVGDCSTVCGDGTCSPEEDFQSCAQDCPPVCGDGACTGLETSGSCPNDCLGSCGNGACDNGETRTSCAQDCGFCGDRVCQDGFESPSLNPPPGQSPCPQDCTVLTCSQNSDCNDNISCTTNVCNNGFCEYAPDHAMCPSLQRCLGNATSEATGCCADSDNDGFASMACRGSDCNDNDATIKPGAFEYCDGVDRNCNGENKPALAQATQLTSDFVIKDDVVVAYNGSVYLAAWVGTPVTTPQIYYAVFNSQLQLVGSIQTVTGAAPYDRIGITYSPQGNRFALMWAEYSSNPAGYFYRMHWIDAAGTISNPAPLSIPTCVYGLPPWQLFWQDSQYVIAQGVAPGGYACPWTLISEAGGATDTAAYQVNPDDIAPYGSSFLMLASGVFYTLLSDNSQTAWTIVAPQSTYVGAGSKLAWDGAHTTGAARDYITVVSKATNNMRYEHFAPNGLLVDSTEVGTAALDPVDTLYVDPKTAGAQGQVAVLAKDAGNFYLFVRNRDSSEALAPGLIAGGQNLTDGHLFYNGNNFVTFWRATAGNVDQIFATTVSCQ